MSLNNLTSETMVTLSARWLHPKKHRKIFTSLPLLAALLPVIQEAHDNLIAKQTSSSTLTGKIAEIQKEQGMRDTRHDRKIRGTHGFLTALAELSDDPEAAADYLDLRERLLPIGNNATMRSYIDQAGDVERLPSRLDDDARKLLTKLGTPDGPLQVHVDAWMEEATQIAMLDEQRTEIAAQLQAGGAGPTPRDVLEARRAWIRVARAVETNIALSRKADAKTIEKILGAMRTAEMKADRRRDGAPLPEDQVDEVDEVDEVPEEPAAPEAAAPEAKPEPA